MLQSKVTQGRSSDDVAENPAAVDDARFMVSHLAVLTNNADTKAGLVATATTVLLGIAFSQREGVARLISHPGQLQWIPIVVFGTALFCGAVAGCAVARTLWPRLTVTSFSRYSWPAVAKVKTSAFTKADPRDEREEAWRTAGDMSRILTMKYRQLRIAIASWLVSAGFLLCWLVIVGWTHR